MNPEACEWPVEKVLSLLEYAGKRTLALRSDFNAGIKEDLSVVTVADKETEDIFVSKFHRPQKETYVIGEEGFGDKTRQDFEQAMHGLCYIVDPLDGTDPYVRGLHHWGISVGLMRRGDLCEGAVHLPCSGEYFYTAGGISYYYRKANGRNSTHKAVRLSSPHTKNMEFLPVAVSQAVLKENSAPQIKGQIHALGCAVVPCAYMALGRYHAYIGKVKLWDIAGIWPVLRQIEFQICRVSDRKYVSDILEVFDKDPGSSTFLAMKEAVVLAVAHEGKNIAASIRTTKVYHERIKGNR